MNYQKYHVVSSADYRRLKQQDDEMVDDVRSKPLKILKEKMPDDAKILLHGAAQRDAEIKREKRKKRPIPVEPVLPKSALTNGVDRMPAILNNAKAIALYEHLKQHGIGYNEKGEVTLHGHVLPNTNLPMVIRGMINYNVGYQPGMKEVLRALPTLPPSSLMSSAVFKKHAQTSPQPSASRRRTARPQPPPPPPPLPPPLPYQPPIIRQKGGKIRKPDAKKQKGGKIRKTNAKKQKGGNPKWIS